MDIRDALLAIAVFLAAGMLSLALHFALGSKGRSALADTFKDGPHPPVISDLVRGFRFENLFLAMGLMCFGIALYVAFWALLAVIS